MEARVVRLTLLNHLFYFTEVSGGSTSATITGNFIGDLALAYVFRKALAETDHYYRHLQQPKYEEIRDFGFYCTVARPVSRSEKTEAYVQNTLFNVDGFVDVKAIEKSGKSPFKNFRQVQGIRLGTDFIALFLSRDKVQLPGVIRVGRALETMVQVQEIVPGEAYHDEFWLNAFSLKTVFDTLDTAIGIATERQKINFSFILENYNLVKQLTQEEVKLIFNPIFGDG